jgi:hypothetical protein
MRPYRFNWAVELYGHGHWTRRWLRWPEWLPFPAYSDHGITYEGPLAKHERENEFRYHFLWSDRRAAYARNDTSGKRVLHIPHPYITLRETLFPLPASDRQGLLVFWPHTTSAVYYEESYVKDYLSFLDSVRPDYSDVNVCIAYNDLQQPWLADIEDRYPVVTAGNSMDLQFPERLFELIDRYEFATSPTVGSQLFYCHLLGVKYFIAGPEPEYTNQGDPNLTAGKIVHRSMLGSALVQQARLLFSADKVQESIEKTEFVEQMLGVGSTPDRKRIRAQLLLELFRLAVFSRHGPRMLGHYGVQMLPSALQKRIRQLVNRQRNS